jgi:hypothetical protein
MEVPFAWDEPMGEHMLSVTAVVRSALPDPEAPEATCLLDIDRLPSKRVKSLVVKGCAMRRGVGTDAQNGRGASSLLDLKSRLEGALARTIIRTVCLCCNVVQGLAAHLLKQLVPVLITERRSHWTSVKLGSIGNVCVTGAH